MLETVAHILALILLPIVGCIFLCLVQRKPREAVFGRHTKIELRRNALLFAGYGCLALSVIIFLQIETLEFTALLWPLGLALGAGVVAMALTYSPGSLRVFARPFIASLPEGERDHAS